MLAKDGDQVGKHGAKTELLERNAMILIDECLDFEQQFVLIDRRLAHPVEQHFDDPPWLVLDQAEQQLHQLRLPCFGQAANHAEIDETDTIARQIEHIAGVWIGVEKAVLDDHFQHGMGAASGENPAIQAGMLDGRQLSAGNPVDEFLHANALARPLPIDLGDNDDRERFARRLWRLAGERWSRCIEVYVAGEVGGDAFGATAFGRKIQFAAQ